MFIKSKAVCVRNANLEHKFAFFSSPYRQKKIVSMQKGLAN